jgi:hypothetical protein
MMMLLRSAMEWQNWNTVPFGGKPLIIQSEVGTSDYKVDHLPSRLKDWSTNQEEVTFTPGVF